MNEKQEPIIILQNSEYPKIYRPKPKKLCNSHNIFHPKKTKKKKFALSPAANTNLNLNKYKNKNENKTKKSEKLDFDKISLEEIERDFNKLKARSEIIEVENELLSLLRNSTKENSLEDEYKEIIKIKRPKNPFLENIE
jgi:hypothetical protein